MDNHHSAFMPDAAYASQSTTQEDLGESWNPFASNYEYAAAPDSQTLPFADFYHFAQNPFQASPGAGKDPMSQLLTQVLPSSHLRAQNPTPVRMPSRPASNPIQQRKERSVQSQPARPSQSSAKRQKANPSMTGHRRCDSAVSQISECCSSCPDTPPCDVSDCCDEPECELQPQAVVTCYEQSCDIPVCSNPCLSAGIKVTMPALPTETRTSNWLDSQWFPSNGPASNSMMHSRMNGGFDGHYTSTSASPTPTTPSMGHNTDTPYSPNTTLPTPQYANFSSQLSYNNQMNAALPTPRGVFDQTNWTSMANGGNSGLLTSCLWNGCQEQHFATEQQWLLHLHNTHIDPQMSFGCPIQGETCPPSMNTNPVDHLQADHGFNFEFGGNGFNCPAPDCGPSQTFFTPSMFHNHFDHVHGVPAQGVIQCEWEACNTSFVDPQELMSHMSQQHKLPVALPKGHVHHLDVSIPAETASILASLPQDGPKKSESSAPATPTAEVDASTEFSSRDSIHLCKWKDGDNQCGEICASEEALQKHIKHAHLEQLDKSSGYKCQWDGCSRDSRRGEKAGFTQRGKLERHMATHTGYKCCQCDECGKSFSAEQSLRQHMLLHRGEKPWKCKHCGKGFPQQSACTIHERTHTKEKPLQCPTCGKCFSESSNLSKHRKIHGEKGLNTCDFPGCGKSFHRFDQLKRHRATHERHVARAKEKEEGKSNGSGEDGEVDDMLLGG